MMTSLAVAVSRDQAEVAELLLDRGADIDRPSPAMATALHHGPHNGSLKTVEVLLNRGANVHFENRWGVIPIGALYSFSNMGGVKEKMVALFVAHGASPEDEEKFGP